MPVSQPLIRTFLLYVMVIFSLTACSSGSKESSDDAFGDPIIHGSGPDAGGNAFDVVAPEANILFPPPSALTGADSITVTGTAADATIITNITVNGVLVNSDDGFLTWRVRVPLGSGANTLEVATTDTLGNRDATAATTVVINNPAFATPQSIAIDSVNSRLVLVDSALGAVLAVDLVSDQRTIISSSEIGQGPALTFPVGIAVDATNNRAIVANSSNDGPPALFSVDLVSGDRTIISDASRGTGPALEDPDQVALDATGTRALVTQLSPSSLFSVDLNSGDRTLVTTGGGGPSIALPGSVIVDATGRALVVDVIQSAVIGIDLATGVSQFVSGGGQGIGPDLITPNGIAIDTDGQIIVSDLDQGALYSIDPVSGDRVILSLAGLRGSGDPLAFPITLAADAGLSYVIDSFSNSIVIVDNASGDRVPLSVAGIGSGVEFASPFGIDIDNATNEALVTDVLNGTVYGVSFVTGVRRVISDATTGVGTALNSPSSVALLEAGSSAIVMDTGAPAVVSIDLINGDRTVISDLNNGGGDPFISPLGAALDTRNDRLLVANPDVSIGATGDRGDNNFVLDVDLGSGNRSVVSRGDVTVPVAAAAIGSGPAFSFPQNIAVDSANQVGYVIDSLLDALIVVDLNNGNRTAGPVGGAAFPRVTDSATLPPALVQDVTLTPDEAVVTDSNQRTVYGFNTTSGVRRLISDPVTGVGTALQNPVSVALDPVSGTLYVVDNALFAVIAIEPVSGDRVIVSR